MKKIVLKEKPKTLIYKRGIEYFAILNVEPIYSEETKFKNSAFVKTGRLVPTGTYNAFEANLFAISKRGATFNDVKNSLNTEIDKYVANRILKGFKWNGYKVWLSKENQQNYASWLTAAKANPEILPLKAKFNVGLMNDEVYYDFTSIKELEDFYAKAIKFINDTINEGRKMKDFVKENEIFYRDSFKL